MIDDKLPRAVEVVPDTSADSDDDVFQSAYTEHMSLDLERVLRKRLLPEDDVISQRFNAKRPRLSTTSSVASSIVYPSQVRFYEYFITLIVYYYNL